MIFAECFINCFLCPKIYRTFIPSRRLRRSQRAKRRLKDCAPQHFWIEQEIWSEKYFLTTPFHKFNGNCITLNVIDRFLWITIKLGACEVRWCGVVDGMRRLVMENQRKLCDKSNFQAEVPFRFYFF